MPIDTSVLDNTPCINPPGIRRNHYHPYQKLAAKCGSSSASNTFLIVHGVGSGKTFLSTVLAACTPTHRTYIFTPLSVVGQFTDAISEILPSGNRNISVHSPHALWADLRNKNTEQYKDSIVIIDEAHELPDIKHDRGLVKT